MMASTLKFSGTADLCDEHGDEIRICEPIFRDFGGDKAFSGHIHTVKCFEDNSLVRQALSQDGRGRVLVVDAGGSLRCAMLGDQLALLAVKNGWAGVVMYGCIRDALACSQEPLGIKALTTHPKKSEKRGIGEENIPLHFAGVDFIPGDRLFADEDGIVLLPG
ncbi:regulator of ribonuclease activity A [Ectothiorhodosinus mongolicus]|uniref:4-hydroxy-4-methyl-2-oxoglutarate aldolase n=1 Tax=Ectothiorhodosinus mongolicus TaxID=233100 RepID=A0A1R3VRD6_9GAMM|nr:ribonuclease E activity regulator RraA [Ectothiorhodosinus mongolicus]ULX57822.1 ribonuclease activity regulator protein RraA [Ectothiorhodosinus mongolicus]SIT65692.1 regulator of ribonuclease activity A [Ectothiorhodosinus mongolicus]